MDPASSAIIPFYSSNFEEIKEDFIQHCDYCLNSPDLKKIDLRKAAIVFFNKFFIGSSFEENELSCLVKKVQEIMPIYIVIRSFSRECPVKKIHPSIFGKLNEFEKITIGTTQHGFSCSDTIGDVKHWLLEHKIAFNEANVVVLDRNHMPAAQSPFAKWFPLPEKRADQLCNFYRHPTPFKNDLQVPASEDEGGYSKELIDNLPKKLSNSIYTFWSTSDSPELSKVSKYVINAIANNYADLMTEKGQYHRTIWLKFHENIPTTYPSKEKINKFISLFSAKIEKKLNGPSNENEDSSFLKLSDNLGILPEVLEECGIDPTFIPQHVTIIDMGYRRMTCITLPYS